MNYIFMTLKLIVFASVVSIPLLTFSQTSPSTPFLYNKGVMIVKGTGANAAAVAGGTPTLYIGGDFVAGSDAATSCDITLENSKTVITKNFLHNVVTVPSTGTPNKNVFRASNATSFENSVISFEGTVQQKITTTNATYPTGIPDKEKGYINFPNIRVNNLSSTPEIDKNNVWLDWRLAAKANVVTLEKGWLTLASKYYVPTSAGNPSNTNGTTHLAHFMPKLTSYNQTSTNAAAKGMIEVELDLGKQKFNNDQTDVPSSVNPFGRMIGLGSPFANGLAASPTPASDAQRGSMKADYFAWNFLLAPNYNSYFGPTGNTITNPETSLLAGKGYILGIDLRGTKPGDYTDIGYYTNINHFNNRVSSSASANPYGGSATTDPTNATAKYIFNRLRYNGKPNSQFVPISTASTEKLITSNFTVKLDKGYNFLSNPYTTPYNASEIIAGIAGIQPKIWLLNSNSSKGSGGLNLFPGGPAPGNKWLQVTLSFYINQATGGTFIEQDPYTGNTGGDIIGSGYLIPPLQMFVIHTTTTNPATTYEFKADNRWMGNTNFLRSTADQNTRKDDFVFEVVDKKTGANDRTNVVLRTRSEIMSNAKFQSVARWATGNSSETKSTVNTTDDVVQTFASQIYTKDTESNNLVVNFLPYTKAGSEVLFTTMYMTPPATQQDIEIKGYRLNTLSSEFDGIFLLDKVANKEIAMNPETVYKTTAKPTDRTDRFVLKFTRTTTGIEDEIEETTKNISSYYANEVLTVTGFDDADFGSTIHVYDIQGRMIKQAKVDDYTVEIPASFAAGAYIVKVVGNNSYVAKFLVR